MLNPGVYNIPDTGAPGVIIINADNIRLDLNGATIAGSGISNRGIGININGRTNVEIRNGNIRGYYEGIRLYNSSSCNIILNNVIGNGDGIHIENSNTNTIDTNYVSGNILGVAVNNADYNLIIRNNVSYNNIHSSYGGIELLNSVNNTLALNTVSRNIPYGIRSTNSSSTINDNIVCNNSQNDFNIDTMMASSGNCNYCDNPGLWRDNAINGTGCTFNCNGTSRIPGYQTITPQPVTTMIIYPPSTPPSTPTVLTPPTPVMSPFATQTIIATPPTPTKTPGFKVLFGIAGLLALVFLLKRR